jgi:Glycosyl transferase family 2
LTRTVNEEGFSVPRLSIIIPHRNDQHLEDTILSVLENRPRDCEIIVVHDGSYRDPYQLADEVVYVQEEPKSTIIEMLNAGLMAACSPVVCILLDGVVVSANWSEPALKRFARPDVFSVAPQLRVGRRVLSGIDFNKLHNVSLLRSGRVESQDSTTAAPTLAAGFYRRKLLLTLGGWNNEIGSGSADVELALLMNELGVTCECEPQVVVQAAAESIPSRRSKSAIGERGSIAAAHGLASASLGATISSILCAAFTGSVSAALAWSSGLRNTTATRETADRLAHAHRQVVASQEAVTVKIFSDTESAQRRKAA